MLESRGEFINAAFRPELHPEPAEHMALHRLSDGRFVGAIIWRSIVTEDYVCQRMATGLQWIPHTDAAGWQAYIIPDAPVIGGRIHARCRIYVAPEFRGERVSWFLTGRHGAASLREGVGSPASQ